MEVGNNQQPFKRSDNFEINNTKFNEITVDNVRLIAKGPKWKTFELMIESIGAVWIEKMRKYGNVVSTMGIAFLVIAMLVLIGAGLAPPAPDLASFILTVYVVVPFFTGTILIVLWFIDKRESILIYTDCGKFKFEGSEGFIEAVWQAIRKQQ